MTAHDPIKFKKDIFNFVVLHETKKEHLRSFSKK